MFVRLSLTIKGYLLTYLLIRTQTVTIWLLSFSVIGCSIKLSFCVVVTCAVVKCLIYLAVRRLSSACRCCHCCAQIRGVYDDVKLNTLYDVLHDPIYRKTWDPNILEGEEICRIDASNDIGYYASQCLPPQHVCVICTVVW